MDEGPGIPPEEYERIFEKFFQSSRNVRGSGTGLGLAISREIVNHHGGEIWVKSDPGAGSTFYFTVPLDVSGDSHVSRGQAANTEGRA
jgi:signal transduction histidine kinase